MPRARSRSSESARLASRRASPSSSRALSGSRSKRSSAIPRSIASATRRACAPSCRSRSILCSSAVAASTAPARVSVSRSTRAASEGPSSRRARWACASASGRWASTATGSSATPIAAAPIDSSKVSIWNDRYVASAGIAHHQAGRVRLPSAMPHSTAQIVPHDEADHAEQHDVGEVLPALGVVRGGLQPRREAAVGGRRPVVGGDRGAEHERGTAPLEPRQPAHAREREQHDREADDQQPERERQRDAGDADRQRDDRHAEAQQQVQRVGTDPAAAARPASAQGRSLRRARPCPEVSARAAARASAVPPARE